MENKMNEVAKLLGLELEEEFRIEGYDYKYKLSKKGLRFCFGINKDWIFSTIIGELLTGEKKIIKIPNPILDDIEKEYLSAVIKPFRKNIITIKKVGCCGREYIEICLYRSGEIVSCEEISFPYFNKGEMYKGMETDKEYTLDELGL